MLEFYKRYIIENLKNNGVDINDYDYKKSDNYNRIKHNMVITFNGGFMTVEEYIERYLLEEYQVAYVYESIYDMGNTCEFEDEDYEDINLAIEIVDILGVTKKDDIDATAKDYINNFYRKDGLIKQLKTYLNFDLELFDKKDKRYKYERCKIIYFIYMLKEYFANPKILMLFNNPSMENIDNSFLGRTTYNGMITAFIKHSFEKELTLFVKNEVKTVTSRIFNTWDNILDNVYILMDFLHGNGYTYDFEKTIHSLISEQKELILNVKTIKYIHSPIETLYLKVVQHEYLGNMTDISRINNIEIATFYDVPSELIDEMKELHWKKVDINSIEEFIVSNAEKLAKYVYWDTKIGRREIEKIHNCKKKVRKLFEFCITARPLINLNDISNELQIVSMLQAILLDSKNETFDYTPHGYQEHTKHKPQVQAALKDDKRKVDNRVVDALQKYWIRKATDHWYANIGRNNMRVKARELEMVCDNIIKGILEKPSLNEMLEMHNHYIAKVDDDLVTTVEQIQAVQEFVKYLFNKGFEYKDNNYKIRYVFLYPAEIVHTYECLISLIDGTINDKDTTLQMTLEVSKANAKEKIEVNLTLFFDYQKNECIMLKFEQCVI